jgi:hypothetical protein
MYPMVERTRQAELDARRAGERARRLREVESTPSRFAPSADVVIREAQAADEAALMRLAELDSASIPSGRVVIVKADGQIRAAMGVEDGALVADPFAATSGLEDLLRLRTSQLRGAAHREHRRRGPLAALRLRAGRAA